MFAGRTLLIAKKHHKEQVMAPLLEKELGVKCLSPNNFDSDILGTFTGEVERENDPLTTARQKCLLALQNNPFDLAIASEGSFGAHPSIFFAGADDELLLLLDTKNKCEIVARHISTETNFNGEEIYTLNDLLRFAETAKFPSHALVLRKSKTSTEGMLKGITDRLVLINYFNSMLAQHGAVFVETDMRAMYNPGRMKVIEACTYKLIEKIKSLCPNCSRPGFAVVDVISGLPCASCGAPTKSTLRHILVCNTCSYKQEKDFPNGKETEDAMYCDFCNP